MFIYYCLQVHMLVNRQRQPSHFYQLPRLGLPLVTPPITAQLHHVPSTAAYGQLQQPHQSRPHQAALWLPRFIRHYFEQRTPITINTALPRLRGCHARQRRCLRVEDTRITIICLKGTEFRFRPRMWEATRPCQISCTTARVVRGAH